MHIILSSDVLVQNLDFNIRVSRIIQIQSKKIWVSGIFWPDPRFIGSDSDFNFRVFFRFKSGLGIWFTVLNMFVTNNLDIETIYIISTIQKLHVFVILKLIIYQQDFITSMTFRL